MGTLLGLDIAALPVALDCADEAVARVLRERYGAFLAAPAHPLVTVHVAVNPDADFVPPREGPWIVETARAGARVSYRSYYDAGWFDLSSGQGAVDLRPPTDGENFIRVLYAHLCIAHGGVMLHASSVLNAGRGYVFFGPSGSGKSTAAHLSLDAGMTVLGDDIAIVRRHGGAFCAFAVPFRGSNARAPQRQAVAPLAGAFALVQSPRHARVPLAAPRALARLLRCVPFVMGEPALSAQAMAVCRQLVAEVPVAELHFRRDAQFWSAILESHDAIPDPA